jgi:hypothetical protein
MKIRIAIIALLIINAGLLVFLFLRQHRPMDVAVAGGGDTSASVQSPAEPSAPAAPEQAPAVETAPAPGARENLAPEPQAEPREERTSAPAVKREPRVSRPAARTAEGEPEPDNPPAHAARIENPEAAAPAAAAPPEPLSARVPEGTSLRIVLPYAINSRDYKSGDSFEAMLAEDLRVDGALVAPRGASLKGIFTEIVRAGKIKGTEEMTMTLKSIQPRQNGPVYPIETGNFMVKAKDTKKKDAATVAGGAVVGTIIGGIAGGKKGAAVGATVGGAAGAGTVIATKGNAIVIPAETKLEFPLAAPVELPVLSRESETDPGNQQ